MTCDMGISAAKAARSAAPTTVQPIAATTQTTQSVTDSTRSKVPPPPGPAPEGMVWIPGGEFWMGAEEFPDAQPWHRVVVDGFWMDKTEVTNGQFAKFVKATKYVTLAENAPRAEDFPGAPPENLVAGSVVFAPPDHPVKLNDHFQWWSYVKGANWRHPEGPQSGIKDRGNYPVVHIAYEDVLAYAKWAGKRLPTEAEYEFAQRGGLERKPYTWGDELKLGGKFMANTFQGHFPDKNTKEDGHERAAPVASFQPNPYGLYDMAGNVWEWTSDWYRHDYYQTLVTLGPLARNPPGPADSFDPSEPGVKKKVHRGGSFLCTDQYCARYIAGGRGKGEPDTGTNHVGFRLVRDGR
ncbi:sulfatase-modifying factor 1 [Nitrospira sp. SCGC AG-212-E16]|nr:sulfatase-modifying factor 1 [Nitrospira sp. SCGC AG-212-E16]